MVATSNFPCSKPMRDPRVHEALHGKQKLEPQSNGLECWDHVGHLVFHFGAGSFFKMHCCQKRLVGDPNEYAQNVLVISHPWVLYWQLDLPLLLMIIATIKQVINHREKTYPTASVKQFWAMCQLCQSKLPRSQGIYAWGVCLALLSS